MKKVMFLNPYLPTLGGGEKEMAYMCQCVEEYFNYDVHIDILVHNYNDIDVFSEDYITIEDVMEQFGIELKCTHIRKVDLLRATNYFERRKNRLAISNIAKEYDLMVNFKFYSFDFGRAKKNLYACMFPVKRYAAVCRKSRLPIAWIRDYMFYSSYDSFINISEYTNKWEEKYWKKDPKNRVIYPPVFSKAEISGRYVESDKKNIIISVGRFFVDGHCKRQVEMVKFFINHPEVFKNYEYHLVGAVSSNDRDLRYLDKVKRLASTVDNVFVHEQLPFDELIELYKSAKIFWHGTGYLSDDDRQPENMEHFGITTVEAMSYGAVPVVIAKGGQPETVKEGVNGFLWSSEEECVARTKQLIDDDKLRQQFAEASTVRANDYSIETFFERNEELFDDIHI